jgi:hypothetical protein
MKEGQSSASSLGVKHNGHVLGNTIVGKNCLHVTQYHLDCVSLEQVPAKWVCEVCEVSGRVRAKRTRK